MKKKPNNPFFNNNSKNILALTLAFFGLLFVLYRVTDYSRQVHNILYSTFMEKVEKKQVKQVHISDSDIYGVLKDGTRFETTINKNPQHWSFLKTAEVEYSFANNANQFNIWYLIPFLTMLMTVVALWYFFRQGRNVNGSGGTNVFSMGKSRARLIMPSTIKEKFTSVAGAAEAKEELLDVVDFLRTPEKYERLGAKMTRGVLLVGAPGNGKTLLARAVAGEANCPFFSISGSDFIEVFVGVGAARVRDLFVQARRQAPCIIFIDEIDAVGRQRSSGMSSGGHEEREQTLNQLLTEMDGFQQNGGSVIVIAATNRPDVLDAALLRPGRFDRRVEVPYPDLASRYEILNVHASTVKIGADVDLQKVARGTPGFSGADLANLINESAIIASKKNQDNVMMLDFEEARDKILLGKEIKSIALTEDDKKIIAYHEAGHALVTLLTPTDTHPLHKVTIIPRGQTLGVTHSIPDREKYNTSKREMLAAIMISLGGRMAEMLVFNEDTTGAYSDFVKATDIARKMVCSYGMSDLGVVVYSQAAGSYEYSPKSAEKIDEEVQKIVKQCEHKTMELLKSHKDKLDLLALKLLEKETLYASEIYELLSIEPRTEHRFVLVDEGIKEPNPHIA
jgi:cell division protease FtsH